ncbi:hypothetical protein SAMN05519104_4336 [Rhizobiales bacterium GAS188]|nr:hypothetical protein SAMN05519104_4336 [Rhizobiales bacterium GAS188]
MILRRIEHYGHTHEQASTDIRKGSGNVAVVFPKYGKGSQNFSDFEVLSTWDDVKAIVEAFAQIGHPAALRLKRAEGLTAAIEALIKNSN